MIRIATAADATGMLAIYAPFIEHTSFTFETTIPSQAEFSSRIRQYLEKWPWLVMDIDGEIAGYAYASGYRERIAYQWSVECSVYIHDNFQGKGIASRLYSTLMELLRMQGFRNVYAVINLPNEKSVHFHEQFGFRYFATYEQVGYKLGQWKNVGWWRYILNEFDHEPATPIPFAHLQHPLKNGSR